MAKDKQWRTRHLTDPYVLKAQAEGYRSRAAYKLLEIQTKDKVFKPGHVVVDLGSTPGGWSQVASQLVGEKGTVVSVDLLPMEPINGVEFIQGDFTDTAVMENLKQLLPGNTADIVISDMAPNLSGNKITDQAKSIGLAEMALEFAREVLKPKGVLLIKCFQGAGSDELKQTIKASFNTVIVRKPKASRATSREVYLLAKSLK